MAIAKSSGIFGIKSLKIAELLTDVEGSAPTYGTAVDVVGIQSLTVKKNSTEKKSKGDEKTLAVHYSFEDFDVSWNNAEVPTKAIEIIEGTAAAVESGTPADTLTITESGNDNGKYFKIMAMAKEGTNVKNVGVQLFKVRGTFTYDLKGEDYTVCSFSGKAIACAGTINTIAAPSRQLVFSDAAITFA